MAATETGGGERGTAGSLGFGEHRAGRPGDLDHHPARERHSRLALGQHAQADQGHQAPLSMLLYLAGDGHGG